MSDDWATKKAKQIIESQVPGVRDLVEAIAEALKQEREIGRLESIKQIELPNEIPEERTMHVRDERGDLIMLVELEWMKQTIKGLSE